MSSKEIIDIVAVALDEHKLNEDEANLLISMLKVYFLELTGQLPEPNHMIH